jgi:hypothetical protein
MPVSRITFAHELGGKVDEAALAGQGIVHFVGPALGDAKVAAVHRL